MPSDTRNDFSERDGSMIRKNLWIGLAIALFGLMSVASARADEWDRKTVLTFSQPFEVPGHVLPAGAYLFKLADSTGDRHLVQIYTADGSRIIATVMTIPDYRLRTTDETVIKFNEVPRGAPEAIRAWFYPGNTVGQEFVYPKARAMELAKRSKAVVPALAVDVTDDTALKTAPIVAITPDAEEVPVTAAIQTSSGDSIASAATVPIESSLAVRTTGPSQPGQPARSTTRRRLPETAGELPLIALVGSAALAVALGLMAFRKRAPASSV